MKSILITGGAGFIGSNFVPYFVEKYPDYRIINLDLLTYAGNLQNLSEVAQHPRYVFVKGDICNRELVEHLFSTYDVRGVVHFAAESHVDNSISGPEAFIKTNVNGTFTLIDVARKYWLDAPFSYKAGYENSRFLHVSTDEVYGTLGETGYFTETTPYAPNSPYSASKAGSDLIVRSYHHTFGMNVVTTNCSNNYGPKQHSEKLIPTIIRKALAQQPIPIYGDGKNVRDWLYVIDHCTGIDAAYHKGLSGETYNIGSRNEQNNIFIATKICDLLDAKAPLPHGKSYRELISFVKDRPGHDRRYAIDSTKIETELGWKAQTSFEQGLQKTIDWYVHLFTQKSQDTVSPTQRQEVTPPVSEKKPEPHTQAHQTYSQPSSVNTTQENLYVGGDKYERFSSARTLKEALEGLAEIKASIIMTQKELDTASQNAKDYESKAMLILQKAQKGEIAWDEANQLANALLVEQNKANAIIADKQKELNILGNLHSKMEENVNKLKTLKDGYHRHVGQMPDSSETISMIERMKAKIAKDEILGDLYGEEAKKQAADAELSKKVDEALGMNPQKSALDALKSQLGINPKKEE